MATNPISSGTGLDINTIVSQLMQIERQPLTKLKQKEVAYQAKVSAYATLLSSVSSLKTTVTALKDAAVGRSATSSDTSYFTATATSSAVAATYTLNINNIATAHSIYSTTFAFETSEVADLSVVTTQKLQIQLGSGTAQNITINSSNNTLSGIRDAINNLDMGIKASTVDSGFVIDASNKTIKFMEGVTTYTATLTEGTYTAAGFAAEVKKQLEASNGSTDTYTVSYDATTKKFTIGNNSGNLNSIDILWEDAGTTAEAILGFTATDHAAIAVGSSSTGDNAVGTYRLILSSNSTGAANVIKIKVDEDNDGLFENTAAEKDTIGLSRLAYNQDTGIANMTQSQAAADAKLKIDNLEVTRASNTISDLIAGVTLTLVKGDSYASTKTLTIAEDTSSLSSKISSFVSAYNATMSAVVGLKGNSAQRGVLSGDVTLTTLASALRSVTTTKYRDSATDSTLTYLGITHDKKGVLNFDSSKLTTAISEGASTVTSMLDSMARSLESTLTSYVNTFIPARKEGYQTTVKNIQKDALRLTGRLEKTEEAMRKKFIALDSLLSQLQGTSNYLTQQMDTLTRIFRGGNK